MASSGTEASNPSAFDGSLSIPDIGGSQSEIKINLPADALASVSKAILRQVGLASAASAATSDVLSASTEGPSKLATEVLGKGLLTSPKQLHVLFLFFQVLEG